MDLVGPSLFGFRIDTPAELTVFAAICLALVTIGGVAALRRGRLGRQLIALRDSEAAYATLGGSLLMMKTLVFAISAGIAGLGGALYGMQLQSVAPEQFNFIAGLGIFLIAVVGGLGVVGNGLFTGTMVAGPLNAIVALWPGAQNLVQTLPAAAGLAYGSGGRGRRCRAVAAKGVGGHVPRHPRRLDAGGMDRGAVAAAPRRRDQRIRAPRGHRRGRPRRPPLVELAAQGAAGTGRSGRGHTRRVVGA